MYDIDYNYLLTHECNNKTLFYRGDLILNDCNKNCIEKLLNKRQFESCFIIVNNSNENSDSDIQWSIGYRGLMPIFYQVIENKLYLGYQIYISGNSILTEPGFLYSFSIYTREITKKPLPFPIEYIPSTIKSIDLTTLNNLICNSVWSCINNKESISILFSGGLDSTILAYYSLLFHKKVNLFLTSFSSFEAPDIVTGLTSFIELKELFPNENLKLYLNFVDQAKYRRILDSIVLKIKPYSKIIDYTIAVSLKSALCLEGFEIKSKDQALQLLGVENIKDIEDIISSLMYSDKISDIQKRNSTKVEQDNADDHEDNCRSCKKRYIKRNCINLLCRRCCAIIINNKKDLRCSAHGIGTIMPDKLQILSQNMSKKWDLIEASLEFKNFSKDNQVILIGSGADEIFGGYLRHRRSLKDFNMNFCREELAKEQKKLFERNFARDFLIAFDTILKNNLNSEICYPFFNRKIIEEIAYLRPDIIINGFNTGIIFNEKGLLRNLAKEKLHLEYASRFKKRALQFGSRSALCFSIMFNLAKRKIDANSNFLI